MLTLEDVVGDALDVCESLVDAEPEPETVKLALSLGEPLALVLRVSEVL